MLPALVGVDGRDDVAPVVVGAVVHDGAVVVPAEGTAAAGGGAVGLVDGRGGRGAGVFPAAEQDGGEAVGAHCRGYARLAGALSRAVVGWWHVFDAAVTFDV